MPRTYTASKRGKPLSRCARFIKGASRRPAKGTTLGAGHRRVVVVVVNGVAQCLHSCDSRGLDMV